MNYVNYKKLKSFNKSMFHNFFLYDFINIYLKISKNLSAKYYQETEERL